MRESIERYLEEKFEVAERWDNESWVLVGRMEDVTVEEIVRLMGLEVDGYGVRGEGEMDVWCCWL